MVMQELPDAQAPENVLTLIDNLQSQLLKSAERIGQVETQCAEQTVSALPQHTHQALL